MIKLIALDLDNTLLEKELIEERGRLDAPGRPILYGTTLNFLKSLVVKSIWQDLTAMF